MNDELELFGGAPGIPDRAEEEIIYSSYDRKQRILNKDNIMHFFESRLRRMGYSRIAGLDEAGRGPLAGPVVAAIVLLPPDFHVEGLFDSKSVSEKVWEKVFAGLTSDSSVKWAVGIVDNGSIDSMNILRATYRAAFEAFTKLGEKPDFLLNDAMIVPDIKIGQHKVIKGDAKSASIAAASIIAKVTRDRIMDEYSLKYPEYGFSRHKGYGTADHIESIRKYGYCPIHRRSFKIDL